MTGLPENITHADQELLVAYLDGELEANVAAEVEQRLATDEEFRKLLHSMQEAWDLLDELPQPTVDDSFTQTTVEMVAVELSQEINTVQLHHQRRELLTKLAQGGALLLCVALGYFAMRYHQGRGDRELINRLPVIERIDQYGQVDDLELLQTLAEIGMFSQSAATSSSSEAGESAVISATSPAKSVPTNVIEARKQRLASMSPSEKQELQLKQKRYDGLTEEERNRRQALNDAIMGHQDSEMLLQVLDQYVTWLTDNLDANERLELATLKGEAKVERIQSLIQDQDDTRLALHGLKPADARRINQWVDEMIQRYQQSILEEIERSNPEFYARLKAPGSDPRFIVHARLFGGQLDSIQPEVATLVSELGEEAQRRYAAADSPEAKRFLLHRWMRDAFHYRFQPPNISDADLIKVVMPKVPENIRKELESLPYDQLVSRLRDYYELMGDSLLGWQRRGPRDWGGRRGGDRGPGRGPRPNEEDEENRRRHFDDARGRGPEARGERPGPPRGRRPEPGDGPGNGAPWDGPPNRNFQPPPHRDKQLDGPDVPPPTSDDAAPGAAEAEGTKDGTGEPS